MLKYLTSKHPIKKIFYEESELYARAPGTELKCNIMVNQFLTLHLLVFASYDNFAMFNSRLENGRLCISAALCNAANGAYCCLESVQKQRLIKQKY